MKFVALFFILFATFASLYALPRETNGDRLARGLPPLPPARRSPDTTQDFKNHPSSLPGGGECTPGHVAWCCKKVLTKDQAKGNGLIRLLELLGLGPILDGLLGLECSLLGKKKQCPAQPPVCCKKSHSGYCWGCKKLDGLL